MNGPGDNHTKLSKSDREKQISYNITYTWNLKYDTNELIYETNGEGNGSPLQCSCLENPRDRGVWWAAVYGVAQSRTQLKRLSIA